MTFDFFRKFRETVNERKMILLLFKFRFSISILNCFNYHFSMHVKQLKNVKGKLMGVDYFPSMSSCKNSIQEVFIGKQKVFLNTKFN